MPIKTFDLPAILDDDSLLKHDLDPVSFDDHIEELDLFDLDNAIFKFFDEKLNIYVTQNNISKKVPVIYATGERWALVRKRKPLQDENGTLILPLIAIRRLDIDRSHEQSLPAGAPALDRLVYKIKRSDENADYQNLRNSVGLTNQDNAAKSFGLNKDHTAGSTSRRLEAKTFTGTVFRGEVVANESKPEIVDIYTIPYPDFFKLQYEVTLWSQYQNEMNIIEQSIFNSFEDFSIDTVHLKTDKGYHFVAFIDTSISNESNFDEWSDTERIIRHTMTLDIPSFTIQTQLGEDHHVHKFTSMPEISFAIVHFDEVTDIQDMLQQNPLAAATWDDIEDNIEVKGRPVPKRSDRRTTTKRLTRKSVSERSKFFPDGDELERFFK